MAKLFVANWKMNPETVSEAQKLAKASDSKIAIICPPAGFLGQVKKSIKRAAVGGQDVFYESSGAYTGQMSSEQLMSLGARYVIIGHSERRQYAGDTNDIIAKKLVAALAAGLTPILCIGENRDEHITGRTKEIVSRQLALAFEDVPAATPSPKVLVVYEPVWAISHGDPSVEADTPENAREVIRYIAELMRSYPVRPTFLYGGSVNSRNIADFVQYPEISGVLVGGASLKPLEVKQMIAVCAENS